MPLFRSISTTTEKKIVYQNQAFCYFFFHHQNYMCYLKFNSLKKFNFKNKNKKKCQRFLLLRNKMNSKSFLKKKEAYYGVNK